MLALIAALAWGQPAVDLTPEPRWVASPGLEAAPRRAVSGRRKKTKRAQPAVREAVGASLAVMALQTSTRHQFAPALQLWGLVDRPKENWGVNAEVLLSYRADQTSTYRYDTFFLRAAAVPELSYGLHATRFHLGAGPAVTWRQVRLRGAFQDSAALIDPGLRLRTGLQGPLDEVIGARGLAFNWHFGMTIHRGGIDYDTGIGVGMQL
jgi:hypothetical protein